MIRPRLPRWVRTARANLRSAPLVTDAPADDLGSLDVANGMGECPPLTDTQAARIMRDLFRACPSCGFLPTNPTGYVLTHHPSGTHYVTYGEDTRVHTVYDQDTPLASEVEAWLTTQGGGAS